MHSVPRSCAASSRYRTSHTHREYATSGIARPSALFTIGTERYSFAYETAGGGVLLSSATRALAAKGAASACPLSMARW